MGAFAELKIADVVDITIVALLLWVTLVWLRASRARPAILGLGILGLLYLVAQQLELRLTVRLFQAFFAVVVLVLVIVFQDDLRRLFERIAVTGLRPRRARPGPDSVDILVRSVERLARSRTGALIVLPGRDPLGRHLEGGVHLRGRLSEALVLSIFDTHSPGHDGAMLVEGNEVSRFGVHLPLSTAARAPGGTRHAAALGLAERSDSLCIVVSEERGTISLARDGRIRTLRDADQLAAELRAYLDELHPPRSRSGIRAFARGLPARWREGLAAVALALVTWATLVPGDAVVEVTFPVRVEVENLPQGYTLDSVDPQKVEVTLRGHRRDLYLAGPSNVRVHLDALLVQLGRRTFEITPEEVDHPRPLAVESISPSKVRVSVTKAES